MEPYTYSLLVVFAILCYMIVVDANVAKFILLLVDMFKLNCVRLVWMIRFHPDNPFLRWQINRRANKIAKQMQEDLDKRRQDPV